MQDEYTPTEHLLLAIASEKEGDAGRDPAFERDHARRP